jgi:hypothetical protein
VLLAGGLSMPTPSERLRPAEQPAGPGPGPADWLCLHASSRVHEQGDRKGTGLNIFWGSVSLAMLVVLVGLLVLMLTADVQRAIEQRHH